ncbi:MAG TPA: epoxide hydrolase [Pseudonocardia sp.]|jgi:pimeloyl-ACP methyl ester carboxylesterase|nr:epoxide hydrolase [Pseudonocardia sp.]
MTQSSRAQLHIEPFEIKVPDEALVDVENRLRNMRWPADVDNDDWKYGTSSKYLKELVDYWLEDYDWRTHENKINSFNNFKTEIDGVPIHFIHERGKGPNPKPLICTHGWPWTFWDFQKVIGPLTDPAAYGGDPADSFDVIVPSLPGFGFSSPLTQTGYNWWRTADLWNKLMTDGLGYDRYFAQGGDWGALVTTQLGHKYSANVEALHVSIVIPPNFMNDGLPTEDEYPDDEKWRFHHTAKRMETAISHVVVNSTDPSSVGFALNNDPAGLAAYMISRRRVWSDSDGDLERHFSKDDSITATMIYWLTETMPTSMRYYWEAKHNPWTPETDEIPVVPVPSAVALWPQELMLMPTPLMERTFNLKRVTDMPAGGHYAPMEQPDELVADVRSFFRDYR